MVKFAASLMCANYLNIEEDIKKLDKAKIDYFHIDIMDGHYVPNLAMNLNMIEQLKEITNTPIDIHLMVDNPEYYIKKLANLKVKYVSFHFSVSNYPLRLINSFKEEGIKIGIAINPVENLDSIKYLLPELDYINIMSVEPGFYGQKFIESVFDKIAIFKKLIDKQNLCIPIEVDGNINKENAKLCIQKGAEILVLGSSSIFRRGQDLYKTCCAFKDCINNQRIVSKKVSK